MALQILKNYSPTIFILILLLYHKSIWLNYQCYTKQSIQPLKDFYKKYNLMASLAILLTYLLLLHFLFQSIHINEKEFIFLKMRYKKRVRSSAR